MSLHPQPHEGDSVTTNGARDKTGMAKAKIQRKGGKTVVPTRRCRPVGVILRGRRAVPLLRKAGEWEGMEGRGTSTPGRGLARLQVGVCKCQGRGGDMCTSESLQRAKPGQDSVASVAPFRKMNLSIICKFERKTHIRERKTIILSTSPKGLLNLSSR